MEGEGLHRVMTSHWSKLLASYWRSPKPRLWRAQVTWKIVCSWMVPSLCWYNHWSQAQHRVHSWTWKPTAVELSFHSSTLIHNGIRALKTNEIFRHANQINTSKGNFYTETYIQVGPKFYRVWYLQPLSLVILREELDQSNQILA